MAIWNGVFLICGVKCRVEIENIEKDQQVAKDFENQNALEFVPDNKQLCNPVDLFFTACDTVHDGILHHLIETEKLKEENHRCGLKPYVPLLAKLNEKRAICFKIANQRICLQLGDLPTIGSSKRQRNDQLVVRKTFKRQAKTTGKQSVVELLVSFNKVIVEHRGSIEHDHSDLERIFHQGCTKNIKPLNFTEKTRNWFANRIPENYNETTWSLMLVLLLVIYHKYKSNYLEIVNASKYSRLSSLLERVVLDAPRDYLVQFVTNVQESIPRLYGMIVKNHPDIDFEQIFLSFKQK